MDQEVVWKTHELQHPINCVNPLQNHLQISAPIEQLATIFKEMVDIPMLPHMMLWALTT